MIRCGRRWGKSLYGGTWASDGALNGMEIGWFAPDYRRLSEVYYDIRNILRPVTISAQNGKVIRTLGGGRIDFWTLDDPTAGRSRRYHRVVIDEAAFTGSTMMATWERAIEPTLFDFSGDALVCSNTNGVDPQNFMWQICNDPKYGFVEYHAPTINNPTIPALLPGESLADQIARRFAEIERIRARSHPLVFRQEYEAEFVDFSGVAFFSLDKMMGLDGRPVARPSKCDSVFAVIDSASKTGTNNDGTAVSYWAFSAWTGYKLVLLDWDIVQIEGGLLEHWLPSVFSNLERLARECGARNGSLGAWIEDAASGIILIQQAQRRNLPAQAIDSKLTALGKDERALSVSGYHYSGEVKICQEAFDKTSEFKGATRNHMLSQVTAFRIGDKEAAKRADDLLDTYCYGIALALGDSGGF